MATDVFGNLQDWGRVLETLDDLAERHLLDEHQAGLARLIRFRDNWRLREKAVECAMGISQASDVLIAEVLNLLVSQDIYLELRVESARALGHLIAHRPAQEGSRFDIAKVTRTMQDMLGHPQAPVLTDAISAALKMAGSR